MKQLALVALLVSVAACGSSTPETSKPASSTPAATPAAPPAAGGSSRVYFMEPKDGATVKGPLVHLMFGSDNYTIAPAPADKVPSPRANTGHYHVGVDTDCLPPGTEIVKGTPTWVHFGKGDNMIDMQLTPGQHKLALQAGDDNHVTTSNMCQQITITVTQ